MMSQHPYSTNPGIIAGLLSFLAGMTMSDVAAFLGILVALASFAFAWRQDRRNKRKEDREVEEFKYRIGELQDRRERQEEGCDLKRRASDNGQ